MKENNNFSKSFNEEFCIKLEFHLCAVFSNCNIEKLKRFWCDGVSHAPFYDDSVNKEYLNPERVLKDNVIETTAWLGESGQDRYTMTIKLGKKAQNNYLAGESLNNCLPSEDSIKWMKIDVDRKYIRLSLL